MSIIRINKSYSQPQTLGLMKFKKCRAQNYTKDCTSPFFLGVWPGCKWMAKSISHSAAAEEEGMRGFYRVRAPPDQNFL